jgi:TPR repeat protein
MMDIIARRVASKRMIAIRAKAAKEAEKLCAAGECAAALVPLRFAIYLGDLPSRALMAWLLIDEREGVARDIKRAHELADKGVLLGCHHCTGVIAMCYLRGFGVQYNAERSLELALDSADKGSKYGQYVLGSLHQRGIGGLPKDSTTAITFFRLAAEQTLDAAQCELGLLYIWGYGDCINDGSQWLQLAAAQRFPKACLWLGDCHETGFIVDKNDSKAIRLYQIAKAAHYPNAACALQRLGVSI